MTYVNEEIDDDDVDSIIESLPIGTLFVRGRICDKFNRDRLLRDFTETSVVVGKRVKFDSNDEAYPVLDVMMVQLVEDSMSLNVPEIRELCCIYIMMSGAVFLTMNSKKRSLGTLCMLIDDKMCTGLFTDDEVDSMVMSIPIGSLLIRRSRWQEQNSDRVINFDTSSVHFVVFIGWSQNESWSRSVMTTIRTHALFQTDVHGNTWTLNKDRDLDVRTLVLWAYYDELFGLPRDIASTESFLTSWEITYPHGA